MYGLHYLENVLYFCVLGELKHLQRRWNCPFILKDLLFSGLTANQCMGKYIFLLQQWKKDSVQRIARNKNISNRTRVLSFQEPCYTSNGALQNDLCDPLRLLGLSQIYTSLTRLFELKMDFRGEVWEKDLYNHKRKKKQTYFHMCSHHSLELCLGVIQQKIAWKIVWGQLLTIQNRWCKSHWRWCCDLAGAKLLLILWEYFENSWLHVELSGRFMFAQSLQSHCSTTVHPAK